jgi:hypothetical protein
MDIQDIVATVSTKTGLDPAKTENAVGIILSVLEHEAEGTRIAALFDNIPGAVDLARRYDVMAAHDEAAGTGGGLLGTLASTLRGAVGGKTGALISGIAQLRACGLDASQVSQAGAALLEQAKVAAGPKVVEEAMDSVPGLKSHLGL